MRTVLPWLPVFLFCVVTFGVGKYLQKMERKRRIQSKGLVGRIVMGEPSQNAPFLYRELGEYRGPQKVEQDPPIYTTH